MGATGEGLLRPSRNRALGGYCSQPRALSPGYALSWSSGNRVLEGSLFTAPSTLSRNRLFGSSGNRVLGGHCSPPRALSPGHTCTDPPGTECSGAATRSPEHSLPGLGVLGRRGTRVLGGHRTRSRALSSRYLDFVDHRGTGVLRGPPTVAPSVLSRDSIFFTLRERLRGMADCWPGLRIWGPPVPDTPTPPQLRWLSTVSHC